MLERRVAGGGEIGGKAGRVERVDVRRRRRSDSQSVTYHVYSNSVYSNLSSKEDFVLQMGCVRPPLSVRLPPPPAVCAQFDAAVRGSSVVQFICRQITSQTPRTCAPWNNMQRYTTSTPETD